MGAYSMTLGVVLVGVFFNTYLYGLVTYQFAAYYRTKFNDLPGVKLMVLFLFILDTFHSAAVVYLAWYFAVENFGDPAALSRDTWPYTFTPGGNALAAVVTQLYLGFRIWRLTNSHILFAIVILLSVPSFAMGMVCCIAAWRIKVLSELPSTIPLVIAWLTMQVVTDTFITTTLVIIFYRSRTGLGKMDTVLNRLIRCAIQTGLFAGLFSLGDLVTFAVIPSLNFYGMFAIPLGRIYTNTLMDNLLTRESLRAEMVGTYGMCGPIKTLHFTPANSSPTSAAVQLTTFQRSEQGTDHV